ncbi:hypothetical protein [Pseudomonas cannabina]|uniref:Uncharacterized protein n=1 Tax=Pseudomonas cannabina TaxID=86840 RepID=A0A0P9MSV8_PSECA|nr:hypothetical protein [Pseudomonas cannabina]KAA8704143.1 hypothetical protein F4W70_23180 [Pseudomonas cannabina]KPW61563.1 hypothetical protein ALO81_200242 [Pseudomonas cannabina]RMN39957.1 hypothetical protein ALQ64_00146 [Pseudomonas cannabina]SDR54854.1 hypothetical protein SAMN05216597_5760 [Pseudomonas cannabina]
MKPAEFAAKLTKATPFQLKALDDAHWRYISLIGLVSDAVPADVVEADQKAYPGFIKLNGTKIVFNDADCEVFMASVTGLPVEMCAAWRDKDFYTLHGETADEMAGRQKNNPKLSGGY